jgi:two-component system sensor histidine kinase RegB
MAAGSASARPSSAHITLRNLVAARWVLLALVSLTSILVELVGLPGELAASLPSTEHGVATALVILAWAGHNGLSVWVLRSGRASETLAGIQLLVDATALTVLLGLAGGASNPFTLLYFLPITLATQVSPRWTWALAAWSLACFASLFVLAPAADLFMPAGEHMGGHAMAERGHSFGGHLRGMWIAFGLTGVLMTFFVHRTALAIARQRLELARLRQQSLEDRHLAAIGTLAAGAAHELGTPLGTMKLLVSELPLMNEDERDEALVTIREQLDRCKRIVAGMASPQLRVESLGINAHAWPLRELGAKLRELDPGVPLRVYVEDTAAEAHTRQPFEVLAQLLRELVTNAAEACRRQQRATGAGEPPGVEVQLGVVGEQLHIEVRDEGSGMDAETLASAFDPFFSTRPEGEGTGLGLYLVRAHLRQLGGGIELRSIPGRGTTATVHLPLTSDVTAASHARG